jgi:hypothetical protein
MLFVECKPDLTLASFLLVSKTHRIEHAGNKTGVLKRLVKRKGYPNYENSLGIIDEDPWSIRLPDLDMFKEVCFLRDYEMRVLHYQFLNNYVLVLCPRLEEWIMEAARQAGIGIMGYDLPTDITNLRDVINSRIDKFQLLLADLKQVSPRLQKLNDIMNTIWNEHTFRCS